jgi:endonuclease YncB( thermonuclease family)
MFRSDQSVVRRQQISRVVPFRRRQTLPRRRGRTNLPATGRHAASLAAIVIAICIAVYAQGYGLSSALTSRYFFGASGAGDSQHDLTICGIGLRSTCLVDGDTGWEGGRKWRLLGIDTPELASPGCPAEFDTAILARDRLQTLMRDGYQIVWSGSDDRFGRALVDVHLSDGRSASDVLLAEGLAQTWPNTGNIWCSS